MAMVTSDPFENAIGNVTVQVPVPSVVPPHH